MRTVLLLVLLVLLVLLGTLARASSSEAAEGDDAERAADEIFGAQPDEEQEDAGEVGPGGRRKPPKRPPPEVHVPLLIGSADNITEIFANHSIVVVHFYQDTLRQSRYFHRSFQYLADASNKSGSAAVFVKVDLQANPSLSRVYNTTRFPCLRVYKKDGPRPMYEFEGYLGDRIMERWLESKEKNPIHELASEEELAELFASNVTEATAVGIFTDPNGTDAQLYQISAELSLLPYYRLIVNASSPLAQHVPNITVLRPSYLDNARVPYTGRLDPPDELHHYVYASNVPDVVEYKDDNANIILNGPIKHHTVLIISKSSKNYQSYYARMKNVSFEFRGKVMFLTLNLDAADKHRPALRSFGIFEDSGFNHTRPLLRATDVSATPLKYKHASNQISRDTIRELTEGMLNGTAKPYYLSADLPLDWDVNKTKVVVGDSFESFVSNVSEHVVVLVYQHKRSTNYPKRYGVILEPVIEAFAHVPNIKFGRFDVRRNQLVDRRSPKHVPAIWLFPAGRTRKDPILHRGEFEIAPIIHFLERWVDSAEAPPTTEFDASESDESKQEAQHGEDGDGQAEGRDEL